MDQSLRITPLGGLGEIGLNCLALECGGEMVVIDAGLMFPEEDMYGVDVVIPDFSFLIENADKLRGVILTHGHEDHIGGLTFLLSQVNVPVYATRLTLALVREKLKESNLGAGVRLNTIRAGEKMALGPFEFEFIKVCHSIIDGVALGIRTPQGVVIHTGDFKIDQSPIYGENTDLLKFAEYGREGVLALLSDSTNVERAGYTISEKTIGGRLTDIFRGCKGRVIVALFASSITRIQQVLAAAEMFNRRVSFSGRSMVTNVRIARELGYLDMDDALEVRLGEIRNLPDKDLVLITTGSQGEPMSALSRMALGHHKQIKIKPGDTVILSSRIIPGNERAITKIINNLYRLGANVIYETVHEIHVSGHAYQEELKFMMNLVRPRFFIPIHGEYRHLHKHAELAREVGIPRRNLLLLEDGDQVSFLDGEATREDCVTYGRVLVDGKGVGDVGASVLRDRHRLAEHGMVTVFLVLDDKTGEIIVGPDLISRGFVFEQDGSDLLENAKCLTLEVLDNYYAGDADKLSHDPEELSAEIKRELKRFFKKVIARHPLILVQITTM